MPLKLISYSKAWFIQTVQCHMGVPHWVIITYVQHTHTSPSLQFFLRQHLLAFPSPNNWLYLRTLRTLRTYVALPPVLPALGHNIILYLSTDWLGDHFTGRSNIKWTTPESYNPTIYHPRVNSQLCRILFLCHTSMCQDCTVWTNVSVDCQPAVSGLEVALG